MDKRAMELAVKALEKYHYYIIENGVADRELLDEGFTAFQALKIAMASQVIALHAWEKSQKDDADYVVVGTLSLGGIEDEEYIESEIDPLDHVIDALQAKYIDGREHKRVTLLAYVGGLEADHIAGGGKVMALEAQKAQP